MSIPSTVDSAGGIIQMVVGLLGLWEEFDGNHQGRFLSGIPWSLIFRERGPGRLIPGGGLPERLRWRKVYTLRVIGDGFHVVPKGKGFRALGTRTENEQEKSQ